MKAWEKNEQEMGTLHIALQMLRSREKGSPLGKPSISYLRDTFTACAILEGILTGKSGESGRASQISRCLKMVGEKDKLPLLDKKEFDHVLQTHPQLWWSEKKKQVMEDKRGTLSYPLANMTNWMLHIDDPDTARRLLTLPIAVQTYLLDVSMWLADLMMLKVIGYGSAYYNRFTRENGGRSVGEVTKSHQIASGRCPATTGRSRGPCVRAWAQRLEGEEKIRTRKKGNVRN